jgi:hypothetical protein
MLYPPLTYAILHKAGVYTKDLREIGLKESDIFTREFAHRVKFILYVDVVRKLLSEEDYTKWYKRQVSSHSEEINDFFDIYGDYKKSLVDKIIQSMGYPDINFRIYHY